jgi:hypothetical protein
VRPASVEGANGVTEKELRVGVADHGASPTSLWLS